MWVIHKYQCNYPINKHTNCFFEIPYSWIFSVHIWKTSTHSQNVQEFCVCVCDFYIFFSTIFEFDVFFSSVYLIQSQSVAAAQRICYGFVCCVYTYIMRDVLSHMLSSTDCFRTWMQIENHFYIYNKLVFVYLCVLCVVVV